LSADAATSNGGLRPKRALLVWEIGGGFGHVVKLQLIGAALQSRGFAVDLALLRPYRADPSLGGYDRLFQAPLLPNLFGGQAPDAARPARDFADVLALLGFNDAAVVTTQLACWRALLDLLKPSVVVTDYSPGAVLAARGRIPTVAVGTPFSVPCGRDGRFLPFWPEDPGDTAQTDAVLGAINAALARFGEPPVTDLPNAVVPQTRFCNSFSELDFYAAVRSEALLPPFIEPCESAPGQGREIAASLPGTLKNDPVVVATLLKLEYPVHIDERELLPEPRSFYEKRGVPISPRLIDTETMARSAAVLLGHGGYHTAARGLVAGVPQVVVASDAEKVMVGQALERLGVGILVKRSQLTVPDLRAAIIRAVEEPAFGEHARALAPTFRERLAATDSIAVVADTIMSVMA
jgi:Erythromycin biosynthesis protein CIII-like, C-terminal domain